MVLCAQSPKGRLLGVQLTAGFALLNQSEHTGEIAALAGVNTTLSGGVAGIVSLFCNLWYLERYNGEPYFDLKYAMNGSLSGLVAITAGWGVLNPGRQWSCEGI
jgi:Amt family ammonium transporter